MPLDTASTILPLPTPAASGKKAMLHHLFRRWSDCRGDRRSPLVGTMPVANDLVLGTSVMKLDVMPDGQFRFVYIGTRIVNLMQRNLSGLCMNECFYGEAFGDFQDKLYFVAAFNMPMCIGARITHGTEWKDIEWMAVPLSDEDGTVVRIVVAVAVLDESHPWQLSGPVERIEVTNDYENCAPASDPTRDPRCALYECSGGSCADLGCPSAQVTAQDTAQVTAQVVERVAEFA